jgi:RNA polymerase sigma factor (sigma-70 family)
MYTRVYCLKKVVLKNKNTKDFVDDVIDREILNALIKELTERQKTVLNLVYFEEMRQQDVADYLGIKQQSVNDLLNRALKTMKKKAENEEF